LASQRPGNIILFTESGEPQSKSCVQFQISQGQKEDPVRVDEIRILGRVLTYRDGTTDLARVTIRKFDGQTTLVPLVKLSPIGKSGAD